MGRRPAVRQLLRRLFLDRRQRLIFKRPPPPVAGNSGGQAIGAKCGDLGLFRSDVRCNKLFSVVCDNTHHGLQSRWEQTFASTIGRCCFTIIMREHDFMGDQGGPFKGRGSVSLSAADQFIWPLVSLMSFASPNCRITCLARRSGMMLFSVIGCHLTAAG